MVKDMLQPPVTATTNSMARQTKQTRPPSAMASVDEAMEPIEASEERNAAMESESVKGTRP